jgi:ribosomal protein L37E
MNTWNERPENPKCEYCGTRADLTTDEPLRCSCCGYAHKPRKVANPDAIRNTIEKLCRSDKFQQVIYYEPSTFAKAGEVLDDSSNGSTDDGDLT